MPILDRTLAKLQSRRPKTAVQLLTYASITLHVLLVASLSGQLQPLQACMYGLCVTMCVSQSL